MHGEIKSPGVLPIPPKPSCNYLPDPTPGLALYPVCSTPALWYQSITRETAPSSLLLSPLGLGGQGLSAWVLLCHDTLLRLWGGVTFLDAKSLGATYPICEWRYDACASPCFQTCRDPGAARCQDVPRCRGRDCVCGVKTCALVCLGIYVCMLVRTYTHAQACMQPVGMSVNVCLDTSDLCVTPS